MPSMRAAMIGTVPAQKVAINIVPQNGLAVPAAVIANVYSQPQGIKLLNAPMVRAL